MIDRGNARRVLERAQKDPVWWAKTVLGVSLWRGQRQILESLRDNREVAVKTCNGVGKSHVAATAVAWFCSVFPDSLALTTAATFRQVRTVLWRELSKIVSQSRIDLDCEILQTEARWKHGTIAIGATAPEHDPTKLQGMRGRNKTLIIVDEACGVSARIIEALKGSMTGSDVRLLMIGNPTDARSAFADAFRSPNVAKHTISAFDSPNFTRAGITLEHIVSGEWRERQGARADMSRPYLVTPEWVADRWAEWTDSGARPADPRWVSRVLGQFASESPDTLIAMAMVERAQWSEAEPSETDSIELGVDVARAGDDSSVIYWRRGPVARRYDSVRGHDLMSVAGMVARAVRELESKQARRVSAIKVDEIGVGAGVLDRLVELGLPACGINVGAGARDKERFRNARAELFWGMRERFESGDIALDLADSDVATQLNAIRWKVDSRGRVELEPKEETKARIGRSPDDADALMLAFAPASSMSTPISLDPSAGWVGPQWSTV
jgi:hypothetical protein